MPKTFQIPRAAEPILRRQADLLSTLQCEELGIGREVRRRLVRQLRWTSPARSVYDTDPVPLDSRVRDDWFDHAAKWRTCTSSGKFLDSPATPCSTSAQQPVAMASGPCTSRANHELFGLVKGGSESPAESSARLSCHDNGVPPDDIQVRFTVNCVVVARADMAWLLPDGRWLVVEIDGIGPHSPPQALVGTHRGRTSSWRPGR
jgi:hypothetical protein